MGNGKLNSMRLQMGTQKGDTKELFSGFYGEWDFSCLYTMDIFIPEVNRLPNRTVGIKVCLCFIQRKNYSRTVHPCGNITWALLPGMLFACRWLSLWQVM